MYPISVGSEPYLTVRNSALTGWRTFLSRDGGTATFENVTFRNKEGSTTGWPYFPNAGNSLRLNNGNVVACENCTFEKGFWITAEGKQAAVNRNSCTTDGADVTAENARTLLGDDMKHLLFKGEILRTTTSSP